MPAITCKPKCFRLMFFLCVYVIIKTLWSDFLLQPPLEFKYFDLGLLDQVR